MIVNDVTENYIQNLGIDFCIIEYLTEYGIVWSIAPALGAGMPGVRIPLLRPFLLKKEFDI